MSAASVKIGWVDAGLAWIAVYFAGIGWFVGCVRICVFVSVYWKLVVRVFVGCWLLVMEVVDDL